jgi:hypothetical protein
MLTLYEYWSIRLVLEYCTTFQYLHTISVSNSDMEIRMHLRNVAACISIHISNR